MSSQKRLIEEVIGQSIDNLLAIGGGCVGEVYRLSSSRYGHCVAKVGPQGSRLDEEGRMLQDLRMTGSVPVPRVHVMTDRVLVMEAIDFVGQMEAQAEEHCADLMAVMHGCCSDYYGYKRDTLIAGMKQPNPPCESWIEFYREHRLFFMTKSAIEAGCAPHTLMDRILKLGLKLSEIAPICPKASLLHGDFWGGNILASKGRIAALIDPAIYYGDPEIDIAFSTLFHTFSPRFYDRYSEHHRLDQGFYQERIDLYNLYPLLVHLRLLGSGYLRDVNRVLRKFGC